MSDLTPAQTMLAWHWLAANRRLQYGTREVVEAGRTYRVEGPLAMCRRGLHASRRALDALQYAPGPVVCRVRLAGTLLRATDKSVATKRHVLWLADATAVLHEFALTVATDALAAAEARGKPADPRSWSALATKRRWLRGLATDKAMAAARDAAMAAAWAAARDAAWAAARAAARAAAWDAAWAAARDAARDAAWDAAWEAAWDAAWEAHNTILTTMLESLGTRQLPRQ